MKILKHAIPVLIISALFILPLFSMPETKGFEMTYIEFSQFFLIETTLLAVTTFYNLLYRVYGVNINLLSNFLFEFKESKKRISLFALTLAFCSYVAQIFYFYYLMIIDFKTFSAPLAYSLIGLFLAFSFIFNILNHSQGVGNRNKTVSYDYSEK